MKISKLNDKKFRTEIELEILRYNGVREHENICNNRYVINGENNLHITIADNHNSELYTVFCIFDKVNELTGKSNSKYNFHVRHEFSVDDAIKLAKIHLRDCVLYANQSKQLTPEQISDYFLSDVDAYKDNIRDILVKYFNVNKESKTYWDAWFRGAENKDLEKADKGVVYNK